MVSGNMVNGVCFHPMNAYELVIIVVVDELFEL